MMGASVSRGCRAEMSSCQKVAVQGTKERRRKEIRCDDEKPVRRCSVAGGRRSRRWEEVGETA